MFMGYAGSVDAKNLFDVPDLKMCSLKVTDEVEVKCFDVKYYDCIINLPVLKLHTTAGFTGAVKNFYALLSLEDKLKMHKYKLISSTILSIMQYLKKQKIISLLDCRYIPSSQQRIWGDGMIYKGNGWVYGDDLCEVDRMASAILKTLEISIYGKDLLYYEHLN